MKLVYERDYPKPGEKWKHFKGHVYEIICIAGDTEREGLDVVYRVLFIGSLLFWAVLIGVLVSAAW